MPYGGQSRTRHIRDRPHGAGDPFVGGSRFRLPSRGEASRDAGLTGRDGDVPRFEPNHPPGCAFDFLRVPAGFQGGDRHDGAIGRHASSRVRPIRCGTIPGRGDRI